MSVLFIYWFEHMLARLWVMNKGIPLGPMDKLEMLCTWLAKYGFGRHVVEVDDKPKQAHRAHRTGLEEFCTATRINILYISKTVIGMV